MCTIPLMPISSLYYKLEKLKTNGDYIATYPKSRDLISELKFKKLGTQFKLAFIPIAYQKKVLKKVCYIISGYFPNIENIKYLAQLFPDKNGQIDIIFRQSVLVDSAKRKIREHQIRKIISHPKIEFIYNYGLEPLNHPELTNNYDLVSLPYIKYGIFESDNMNLESIQNFTSNNEIPLLIF